MTSYDILPAAVPWSGTPLVAPVDQRAAVDRLPGSRQLDPFERLAMAFLFGSPTHSARAYGSDLRAWWGWCLAARAHPFDARRHHVDAWVRVLSSTPLPPPDGR
jgi:hypothetical protein